MLSGSQSVLLYLSSRQFIAALSLGSLWVAVNQHPLELKLKRDVNVIANTILGYAFIFICNTEKNLEMLRHGADSSL